MRDRYFLFREEGKLRRIRAHIAFVLFRSFNLFASFGSVMASVSPDAQWVKHVPPSPAAHRPFGGKGRQEYQTGEFL